MPYLLAMIDDSFASRPTPSSYPNQMEYVQLI
jgi:hypothetical protein